MALQASMVSIAASLISVRKLDFPVLLKARGIEVIDELLSHGVWHSADFVHERRSNDLGGCSSRFAARFDRPMVADDNPRNWEAIRHAHQHNPGGQLVLGAAWVNSAVEWEQHNFTLDSSV